MDLVRVLLDGDDGINTGRSLPSSPGWPAVTSTGGSGTPLGNLEKQPEKAESVFGGADGINGALPSSLFAEGSFAR